MPSLPTSLHTLPGTTRTCVPEPATVQLLAQLSAISAYFAVTTGPPGTGWRPVRQLYDDAALLAEIVGHVQARIGAAERRVAASTFFFGVAARLWSIGLGALAGHALLLDLAPEHVLVQETDGQLQLHIEHPVAWQADDAVPLLADMVLDSHLAPLAAALRSTVSEKLLRGNAASALLGAARVFDRAAASRCGWRLALQLCQDARLTGAVIFHRGGYRRTSCCLYYRTAPDAGLCGDCVLPGKPGG